ncbi:MAG: glycoside hydrolase family 28 protein [Balneolaceae bacterium]
MKQLFGCCVLLSCFLSLEIAEAQITGVPAEIIPIDAPFDMADLQRTVFPDTTFDIRDYGAIPMDQDSGFKNTGPIHQTIEAAHDAGGGVVLIPEGEWLTGPIHLKSNIHLFLADGAEVHFSSDKSDYLPVVPQRHEGVEAYNYSPLIYAQEVENVAITGSGSLEGHGDHWWSWADGLGGAPRGIAAKSPLSQRQFGKGAGMEGMRPNFVVFWKSKHILIEGITLNDSPMWNIHLVYSRDAIVRNITVNSLDAPNGDGVVLDSSSDVLVEYNRFNTGDDAVVLKSGFNEDGLQIGIPTERIVVRNFEARDIPTGSGGIVFGSETSGGIRDIYVHDAYFEGTDRGIRFKTERGRGNIIENIYIRDIEMKDLNNHGINMNTFYTGPTATGPAPLIRNVDIRNIRIDGVPLAIELTGLPEKWLENVTLQDITVVNAETGARVTRAKNMTFRNVSISSASRALIVDDVYEFTLEGVTLKDNTGMPPMLIRGEYTGAIFTDDYPIAGMAFEEGLTGEIVQEEPAVQIW